MRKVILAALMAYAATGCVAEDTGLITANWSFKEISSGSSLTCPTGFDTTAVHVIPVDAVGNRQGAGTIDLYNCSAFTGTADYAADGRYEVFMEITTPTNSALYADTPSVIVDLRPQDVTVTQTIIDDGGFFYFDWALRGASSNSMLTCSTAGAAKTSILVTLNGTTQGVEDKFDCERGGAYTGGLVAGSYTVSIAALNGASQSVGTVPALTNQAIRAPNKTTDLNLITIPIDGL